MVCRGPSNGFFDSGALESDLTIAPHENDTKLPEKIMLKTLKSLIPRPIKKFLRAVYNKLIFSLRTTFFPVSLEQDYPSLHLGCGDIRLPGFINIDFLQTAATDLVADITILEKFKENSVSSMYACQVLEHFSHDEIPRILKRWFEVIKPGGSIRISVPDIDRIVKIYLNNWEHFRKEKNSPWIGLIYGGQKDQYDFHKTGFNAYWLKLLLEDAGFINAQEYPHTPHFTGQAISDGSMLTEPFGEYFTLNMLAFKPAN